MPSRLATSDFRRAVRQPMTSSSSTYSARLAGSALARRSRTIAGPLPTSAATGRVRFRPTKPGITRRQPVPGTAAGSLSSVIWTYWPILSANVVARYAAVLDGFEKEPITKSYKLITLQALLQMGALRHGASVAEIAFTTHRIVSGDPRLLRRYSARARCLRRRPRTPEHGASTGSAGRCPPGPGGCAAPRMAGFASRASRVRAGFPSSSPPSPVTLFDSMVDELVDYRLARYLFATSSRTGVAARLKVIQTQWPILNA